MPADDLHRAFEDMTIGAGPDPTREEFGELVIDTAHQTEVRLPPGSLSLLIDKHYRNRPMRFCHPRDLLQQVADHARYAQQEAVATPDAWDRAVANYFGASGR
ncbi:MAG: hypothetical protein EXR71_15900 [Myxococcales bacterium]|nr:hypothetical protein [Myxococcales bacterium]